MYNFTSYAEIKTQPWIADYVLVVANVDNLEDVSLDEINDLLNDQPDYDDDEAEYNEWLEREADKHEYYNRFDVEYEE